MTYRRQAGCEGEVKVMSISIVPIHEASLRRSGIAHIVKG